MLKKGSRSKKAVVAILAVFVLALGMIIPTGVIFANNTGVAIDTNKDDYSPGELVIITGKNFQPDTVYEVVVIRPDGSIVLGDGSFEPGSDTVVTNLSGNFNYHYQLNGIEGLYTILVKDLDGTIAGIYTFTDATVRW